MSLTFAIGDLHGQCAHFIALLKKIEDYAAGREHKIITLGDYCDRGPDSKGVLDILMSRPDIIKLKGNHEEMLLAAYNDYAAVEHFEINGGKATMRSFGLTNSFDSVRHIPQKYIDFLRNDLRMYYEDDLRVFVHAGIDPNITDMSQQREIYLLWMREPFLSMTDMFFKHVVHGHTPQMSGMPEFKPNRTNLDTGCFRTGILSCAVFDDLAPEPLAMIQVRSSGINVS